VLDYPHDHGLDGEPAAAPLGADGAKSYEELYVEHAPAARRLALSLVPADVADDIVAEAFARVLAAIRAGGGPSRTFQGYLLTAVRNAASDWLRAKRRLTVVGDMDVGDLHVAAGDPAAGRGRVNPGIGSAAETQAAARDEARLVARAFGRLPARWRAVLWQLEVEGKAPAAVAPMFGLSANGVSALAMRAREGLRQAYLEEHVGTNIPLACRTYAGEFGAGARGRLSQRRRAAMQEHLGHCPACQNLFTELTELNSRLGAILTPAALAAATAGMRSGRRAMMIRTGLNGSWRNWRPHPVTAAVGAAAGVAVAGGMLFAVNVTPITSSPSHVTVQAAVPAAATSGPTARRHAPSRGGAGGGGGAASLAGAGSRAPGSSPAGATLPGGPSGPSSSTLPASSATGSAVGSTAGRTMTSVASAAGTTVSGLAGTAGAAVSGLTGTAGAAVSGVTSAAGAAVSGVTSAAGAAVSSVTGTAGAAVSGVTGTVGSTVTSVASAAGTTVSGLAGTAGAAAAGAGKVASSLASTAAGAATEAGSTVSSVASTAGGTVAGTVSTVSSVTGVVTAAAGNAVSSPATTAAAATTNAARPVATSATESASTVATAATDTASTAAAATTGLASATATAATDIGSTVATVATTPEARPASAGSSVATTTTGLTSAAEAALQP
jgi:RNA polymerase sigma factor (sigma-70 family)